MTSSTTTRIRFGQVVHWWEAAPWLTHVGETESQFATVNAAVVRARHAFVGGKILDIDDLVWDEVAFPLHRRLDRVFG